MKNLLYLSNGNSLPSCHKTGRQVPITLYHLLKICVVMLLIVPKIQSQTAELSTAQADFELRKSAYIETQSQNQILIDQVRDRLSQSCDGHVHEVEEGHLTRAVHEEAKMEFLRKNIDLYHELYFPPSAMSTTVEICDNGGFESGFTNYTGSGSTFRFGSDDCTPGRYVGMNFVPSTFTSLTLPTAQRIEIVDTGTDTLVGISRTKFGSKALRINHRYGHVDSCDGDQGVDRITKEFLVSDSSREFTVWFAVVLENPSGHDDTQPFLASHVIWLLRVIYVLMLEF